MKRSVMIIGAGILLLFILAAAVGGSRVVAADNRSPASQKKGQLANENTSQPEQAPVDQVPGNFDDGITAAQVLIDTPEEPNVPSDVDDSQISWQTINAGGGDAESMNNEISCSVWQPAIGRATSANLRMGLGFWYGVCNCGMLWGDLNCDAALNPVDVVYLVNYVYLDKDIRCYPPGWNCPFDLGDVNCDGNVNPVDVVYYVNYVYLGNNMFCDNPCAP